MNRDGETQFTQGVSREDVKWISSEWLQVIAVAHPESLQEDLSRGKFHRASAFRGHQEMNSQSKISQ